MSLQFMLRFLGVSNERSEAKNIILPTGDFYIGNADSTPPYFWVDVGYMEKDQLHLRVGEGDCSIGWKAGKADISLWKDGQQQAGSKGQRVTFEPGAMIRIAETIESSASYVEFTLEAIAAIASDTTAQPLLSLSKSEMAQIPLGLQAYSMLFLKFLPEIYQPSEPLTLPRSDFNSLPLPHSGQGEQHPDGPPLTLVNIAPDTFLARYLGIFESIFLPIAWTVDNFELFLSPTTAPIQFLPWFEAWSGPLPSTDEATSRRLLRAAIRLKAWQGTKYGLRLLLWLYTGKKCQIIDQQHQSALGAKAQTLRAHEFCVKFSVTYSDPEQKSLRKLIELHKPAHTIFCGFCEI